MKLTLHHINLCTDKVEEMDSFYRDVMGLERPASDVPAMDTTKGFNGDVAFVSDGAVQTHLARKDVGIGFRTGHLLNPLSHGHIAYRTDDIEAFIAHLDERGIPYSDWGHTATAEWRQIFFYDPDGNVVEVHQVMDAE